jgi:hypothetical protein
MDDEKALKDQMREGMNLISKLIAQNQHIHARSWTGTLVKTIAHFYHITGQSYEDFQEELAYAIHFYKFLWEEDGTD